MSTSCEILDLRHFTAAMVRPILDAEGQIWKERLRWDYRASARLLMQYLDNHILPGYAAVLAEQVIGYVFCVYEETKAVIGDVFAVDNRNQHGKDAHKLEEVLLTHLLELLVNSPQVDRIESQLLLHTTGSHSETFRAAGFEIFKRLFMVQQLRGLWSAPQPDLPGDLELRSWRDEDLAQAARLICEAYRNHPDSQINDQYRTVHGSMRFLNNIVRYSGCGTFSAPASHVVVHRTNREFVALVLGSRVSQESGHITQLCVHPAYRRHGLARMLLGTAAFHFMRQGATEVSLTVTEANQQAIDLYLSDGYKCTHQFDAAVWER